MGKKVLIKITALIILACMTAFAFASCGDIVWDTSTREKTENDTDNDFDTDTDTDSEADTDTDSDTDTDVEPTTHETVKITVTAVGDCTLGTSATQSYSNSFDYYYDNYGKDYFFKNVLDITSSDDFTIANLEGPLTTSNEKQNKMYNHRGKPEYVSILQSGSIEAVSYSNNHTLDYGTSGENETMRVLSDAGIAYANDSIYGIYETKGIKIGFVSVDDHYDGALIEVWLEDGVNYLKAQGANLIIACIHWGHTEDEQTSHVDSYQYELGKKCVDWGYDLVIGNHVHVLEGIDCYKGRYITYCLGNFCYGGSKKPSDKDCGIFQQTFTFVDGKLTLDSDVKFIPCSISSTTERNNMQPTPAAGSEYTRILNKMNVYSAPYSVAFGEDGKLKTITLTDSDKSQAIFAIFKRSLDKHKLGKETDGFTNNIKYVAVDISEVGFSDVSTLRSLLNSWAAQNGVSVFVGTKSEIVHAGYADYCDSGIGRIFFFEDTVWSGYSVSCNVLRNVTLLNYFDEPYIASYCSGIWKCEKGSYIQL